MVKIDLKNVGLDDIQIGGVNLNKVNWKQKLSSRKLWMGVALVAMGIVLCVNGDVENGIWVTTIGASVYLGVEAIVDVVRLVFQGLAASDDKMLEEILREDAAVDIADNEDAAE